MENIDTWAQARILAYRSQRDLWKRINYILLGVSALTAIGAAISAGLKVQLWTIIFAGMSAGLSVINASLKSPTQVTKLETALATTGALRAKITAFLTDLRHLPAQDMTLRLKQCREDYEQVMKLPSPSHARLTRAANTLEITSSDARIIVASGNVEYFDGGPFGHSNMS
jgi:hypothetical protein